MLKGLKVTPLDKQEIYSQGVISLDLKFPPKAPIGMQGLIPTGGDIVRWL